MKNPRLKKCKVCNGTGRKNCSLGSLTCGECLGAGKVELSRVFGNFVENVVRQLKRRK